MQTVSRHAAVTIDSTEDRAFRDVGGLEPLAKCLNRAGMHFCTESDGEKPTSRSRSCLDEWFGNLALTEARVVAREGCRTLFFKRLLTNHLS